MDNDERKQRIDRLITKYNVGTMKILIKPQITSDVEEDDPLAKKLQKVGGRDFFYRRDMSFVPEEKKETTTQNVQNVNNIEANKEKKDIIELQDEDNEVKQPKQQPIVPVQKQQIKQFNIQQQPIAMPVKTGGALYNDDDDDYEAEERRINRDNDPLRNNDNRRNDLFLSGFSSYSLIKDPYFSPLVRFTDNGFAKNDTLKNKLDTFFDMRLFQNYLLRIGKPMKLYDKNNNEIKANDYNKTEKSKEQEDKEKEEESIIKLVQSMPDDVQKVYVMLMAKTKIRSVSTQNEVMSIMMIDNNKTFTLPGGDITKTMLTSSNLQGIPSTSIPVLKKTEIVFKNMTGSSLPETSTRSMRRYVYLPKDKDGNIKEKIGIYLYSVSSDITEKIIRSARSVDKIIRMIPLETIDNIINKNEDRKDYNIDNNIIDLIKNILTKIKVSYDITSSTTALKLKEYNAQQLEMIDSKLSKSTRDMINNNINSNIRFLINLFFSNQTVFIYRGNNYSIQSVEWVNNKYIRGYPATKLKSGYQINIILYLYKLEKGKLLLERIPAIGCQVKKLQLKRSWDAQFTGKLKIPSLKEIQDSISNFATNIGTNLNNFMGQTELNNKLMTPMIVTPNRVFIIQYNILSQELLTNDVIKMGNTFNLVKWKNTTGWNERSKIIFNSIDESNADIYCFQQVQCVPSLFKGNMKNILENTSNPLNIVGQFYQRYNNNYHCIFDFERIMDAPYSVGNLTLINKSKFDIITERSSVVEYYNNIMGLYKDDIFKDIPGTDINFKRFFEAINAYKFALITKCKFIGNNNKIQIVATEEDNENDENYEIEEEIIPNIQIGGEDDFDENIEQLNPIERNDAFKNITPSEWWQREKTNEAENITKKRRGRPVVKPIVQQAEIPESTVEDEESSIELPQDMTDDEYYSIVPVGQDFYIVNTELSDSELTFGLQDVPLIQFIILMLHLQRKFKQDKRSRIPIILTGCLNSTPTSFVYKLLLSLKNNFPNEQDYYSSFKSQNSSQQYNLIKWENVKKLYDYLEPLKKNKKVFKSIKFIPTNLSKNTYVPLLPNPSNPDIVGTTENGKIIDYIFLSRAVRDNINEMDSYDFVDNNDGLPVVPNNNDPSTHNALGVVFEFGTKITREAIFHFLNNRKQIDEQNRLKAEEQAKQLEESQKPIIVPAKLVGEDELLKFPESELPTPIPSKIEESTPKNIPIFNPSVPSFIPSKNVNVPWATVISKPIYPELKATSKEFVPESIKPVQIRPLNEVTSNVKNISYLYDGNPLTYYITHEYDHDINGVNYSDHIPIIYPIIGGNNNLQIATWNISIKGKKVIDPSGATYYSHKFKNLFDETDEEYKNRLETIASVINSIIDKYNLSYLLLQELPSNNNESTFFETILKNTYNLKIIKPESRKIKKDNGNIDIIESEFGIIYNPSKIINMIDISNNRNSIKRNIIDTMQNKNKIQKIYQGESADKRIYEDVLKTSVFTDNENKKLFINIHAKGIDLSNKKLIEKRKKELLFLIITMGNHYIKKVGLNYDIIFIGDFNVTLIPSPNIIVGLDNLLEIHTTPGNKGYSYVDNNNTMTENNIDLCVVYKYFDSGEETETDEEKEIIKPKSIIESSMVTDNDILQIQNWINNYVKNNNIEVTDVDQSQIIGNIDEFSNLFKEEAKNKINNIEIINTIGDGSCFIHSLFTSISDTYRKILFENRRKIAQDFRTQILANMTDNEYLSESGLSISQNIINKYKNNFSNLSFYLTNEEIQLISNKYKINFMFFVLIRSQIMPNHISTIFVNNDPSNKDKFNWIFVYNTEETHYSALREKPDKYIFTPLEGNYLYENSNQIKIGGNYKITKKNNLIFRNKTKRILKKLLKNN